MIPNPEVSKVSLGPSVVELFFYSRYRYRYDLADHNFGIGYSMYSVANIKVSIESLIHQISQNLYPMGERQPIEADNYRW
jgi:hypothetical protein